MRKRQSVEMRAVIRALIQESQENKAFPQGRGTTIREKSVWRRKDSVLRSLGFRLMSPNNLYVNEKLKKVFSWEYIQRKSLETVCEKILEENRSRNMRFYFLKIPSKALLEYFTKRIKKSVRKKGKLLDQEALKAWPHLPISKPFTPVIKQ